MDGVGMMGYARLSQISTGLRQRQKARAFVVAETRPTFLRRRDVASESKRDEFVDEDDFDDDHNHHHVQKRTKNALVALVVVDACMVFPDLKPAVLRRVAEKVAESSFGAEYQELDAEGVLDEANVCVCATHTHSAPGGYAPHGLYNLTFGGAVSESFDALLNGAADALFAAFVDAFETSEKREPEKRTVAFARGALVGASANRSSSAHARNPETDTAPFARAGGVDETIAALVVGRTTSPKEHSFPAASPRGTPCTARPFPGRTRSSAGTTKGSRRRSPSPRCVRRYRGMTRRSRRWFRCLKPFV